MTELQMLNPRDLVPSPTNPRKHNALRGIEELTESVRAKGVLQPIVVRPKDGGHEVVFGHRRREAAVRAERDLVPCLVSEYSDDEVLEAQLVENLEREDVHPLDEADGFAELARRGYSSARIAEKIGRPSSYVAQRLRLRELSPACRAALDEERITLGAALLLARHEHSIQDEALEYAKGDQWTPPATVSELRKRLEDEYMLRLDRAPFDLGDATLVPEAGPCTTCPRRTGNQTELFADASSKDLCLDRGCYSVKLDALVRRAKDEGRPVLEGEEARRALAWNGPLRRLDDREYFEPETPLDPDDENAPDQVEVTIRELYQAAGKKPEVVLVRDGDRIVEAVNYTDVAPLLEQKAREVGDTSFRVEKPSAGGGDSYDWKKERDAAERKLKRRRKAIVRAIELAVEQAKHFEPEFMVGFLVRTLAERVWNDVQKAVLERRGIAPKPGQIEKQMLSLANGLTLPELTGLGVEIAMRAAAPWSEHVNRGGAAWYDALALCRIDFKGLEKQVAAEERAKKKGKAKGTKTKGKTAKPSASAGGKKGKRAKTEASGPTLVWDCDSCHVVEPVDNSEGQGYEVGDTEPCVHCGEGTAYVRAEQTCRECGCTDLKACEGGCAWVEPDLCSSCAPKSKSKSGSKTKTKTKTKKATKARTR